MKFIIDGKEVEASEVRFHADNLQVVITHEGIILDALDDEGQEVAGTRGMTFDEWREDVLS
jgi:hypothetical protein